MVDFGCVVWWVYGVFYGGECVDLFVYEWLYIFFEVWCGDRVFIFVFIYGVGVWIVVSGVFCWVDGVVVIDFLCDVGMLYILGVFYVVYYIGIVVKEEVIVGEGEVWDWKGCEMVIDCCDKGWGVWDEGDVWIVD